MPGNFRDDLRKIIDNAVNAALDAYRAHLARHDATALGRPARATRAPRLAVATRTCAVPGCHKPSTGPRFRFLCVDHRVLPRDEQDKLLGTVAKAPRVRAAKAAKPAAKPKQRGWRAPEAVQASVDGVYQFIVGNPGLTAEQIAKQMRGNRVITRDALNRLRAAGKVKTQGLRRATTYTVA